MKLYKNYSIFKTPKILFLFFLFFFITLPLNAKKILKANCSHATNQAIEINVKNIKISEKKNFFIFSLNLELSNKISYSHLNIYNPSDHFFLIINDSIKIISRKKNGTIIIDKTKKSQIDLIYQIPKNFLKIDFFYFCQDYGNIKINLLEIGNHTPDTNYEFNNFSFSGITVGIVQIFNTKIKSEDGCLGFFEFNNKNSTPRKISTNFLFKFIDKEDNSYYGKMLTPEKKYFLQNKIKLIPSLKEKIYFFFPGIKVENIDYLLLKSKLGSQKIILKRF